MVTDQVKRTILERSLIAPEDHVVVGVSGGPDSTCLLHVLWSLSDELGFTIHVVHINHRLRKGDADLDQAYTEQLCETLSIPCTVYSFNVKKLAEEKGLTTEEMGRNLRYEAFQQVRTEILEEGKALGEVRRVKIAVAQNWNDQAETVMMRILRGTGTDGLASMDYERDDVIIRPLLDVSRQEIEAYCAENRLQPRIDESNRVPIYLRNQIRLELFPYLEQHYNPEILSALNRLAKISNEDKEFIYQHVKKALETTKREGGKRIFSRESYRALHPAIRKRVLLQLFKELGLMQDVTATHLSVADKLIKTGDPGESMDFPKGFQLRISYDQIELFQKSNQKTEGEIETVKHAIYPIRLNGTTELPAFHGTLKARAREKENSTTVLTETRSKKVFLDLSDLSCRDNLFVRTRRPGDYLTPFGMSGTKKLQDFFVDAKVKREDRDKIPLLCCGSEVVWVIGYRINDRFKVSNGTKEVIVLEYKELL